MKYIRTWNNLKKIMEHTPELTEHTEYENRNQDYIYKDDNIEFALNLIYEEKADQFFMSAVITCGSITASLHYASINERWEFDSTTSSKQKTITAINKEIKKIVKAIENSEYKPTNIETECPDLSQEEKIRFLDWLIETGEFYDDEKDDAITILNNLKNEKYTASAIIRNGKLRNVYIRENGHKILFWRLNKINRSNFGIEDEFIDGMRVLYGKARKYELAEEEVSEVEKILNNMKEMTDGIKYHNEEQEVFNKAYEVILNNLDKAVYVKPNKFGNYEKVYVVLGNDGNISIDLSFKKGDYIFINYSDFSENEQHEDLSYYPGYRHYEGELIRDPFRDRFCVDNNPKNLIEILDKLLNKEEEKAEQLSETDKAQPNHINQDNYTLSFDNMEEAYNQEINNEGSDRINFPKKRRMVISAALEKAIQEFIFKVKDGEIQRNTDNFYQVLKNHDVNRIIELPEWDYCEIICTVPDNNKRYVIELGYDESKNYNEVINRIDYHVNSR